MFRATEMPDDRLMRFSFIGYGLAGSCFQAVSYPEARLFAVGLVFSCHLPLAVKLVIGDDDFQV